MRHEEIEEILQEIAKRCEKESLAKELFNDLGRQFFYIGGERHTVLFIQNAHRDLSVLLEIIEELLDENALLMGALYGDKP